MSDTFVAAPTYLHNYTGTAADATAGFAWPRGISGQGFMVGEDGNHYFMEWPFQIAKNTICSIGCVESGVTTTISKTKFATDYGDSIGSERNRIPIPGTKYFWVIGIDTAAAPPGYSFRYQMVLYKIVDDATFTAVRTGHVDVTGLQSWLDDDLRMMGYNAITGTVRIVTDIKNAHVIDGTSLAYVDLAATEDTSVPIFGNWFYIEDFDEKFFDFTDFTTNGVHSQPGAVTMAFTEDVPQILFYVDAAAWSAIQADPTHSDGWASITGVGVYRYNFGGTISDDADGQAYSLNGGGNVLFKHISGGSITSVTSFGTFSDAGKERDGTSNNPPPGSTDRPVDDYTNIHVFDFHGTQYVIMNKTYSTSTDLNVAGTGTYGKSVIWAYDGATATLNTSFETSYFSTTDIGSSGTQAANIVNVGAVGDDLYYIWGVRSIAGEARYVVGRLAHGTHVDATTFHVYFSEFRDTTFRDWTSTTATDFTAYLDTWYALQDDAALWMMAPWLTTYIMASDDEGGGHDELLLTPRWEWTDAVESHKWGEEVNCYRAAPAATRGTVLDARHRVRGKGRALQLHYESTGQHPFNLLGWSIDIDRNAQP